MGLKTAIMKNRVKIIPIVAFAAFFLVVAGCGDKHKVGGRVVFSDGEPVTSGIVYFTSPTFMGRANINPDGSYDVSSIKPKDGLPEGKYKVYVLGAFATDDGLDGEIVEADENDPDSAERIVEKPPVPLVHPKYCSADAMPLEFSVPGSDSFEIVVERFPTDE